MRFERSINCQKVLSHKESQEFPSGLVLLLLVFVVAGVFLLNMSIVVSHRVGVEGRDLEPHSVSARGNILADRSHRLQIR